MKIYYQGIPWAYSSIAAKEIQKHLSKEYSETIWVENFDDVWNSIDDKNIAILPIENSYAGSIHHNVYNFLYYNYEIIGEISIPIHHCLLTQWDNIKNIKKAYSHPQALAQCRKFGEDNNIEFVTYTDTALAAQMVKESNDPTIAAIASDYAGELYKLNILKKDIQDQNGNTTRFLIIKNKDNTVKYNDKKEKVAMLFQARNLQGVLYKCLWAFATNGIDLTKIESLPSQKDPFTYMFWIECKGKLDTKEMKDALHELEFYTEEINILWEY